jgi:signal transduction histidine kinase
MLGYASLLLDEEMTEEMTAAEQREHIKRIETCSRVLLGILNDIFDFAKIRADRVELEQEPFGLCDSVEETLGLLAHNASSGGVNLVSAMDDRVPTQLLGDVERLRQIFMNLVDHLISNSKMRREYEGAPEQTVLVAVKPSSPPAAGTSTTHVHITVSNSCTELSEGPHTTIRTIAATLADTRSSHWHHSKLGLPISYHFVEMMGGRISTEEEGGRICTFHLELPFEPAPTP